MIYDNIPPPIALLNIDRTIFDNMKHGKAVKFESDKKDIKVLIKKVRNSLQYYMSKNRDKRFITRADESSILVKRIK